MAALAPLIALVLARVALVTDLRWRRIPNWLSAAGFLGGIAINLAVDGLAGGLLAIEGAALGLLLLIPFYVIRAVGAGDVKMLAALGALVGPHSLISIALLGGVVGGLQSLIILASRGRLQLVFHQMFVMRTMPTRSGAKAPYLVAIAAGVYLTVIPSMLPLFAG